MAFSVATLTTPDFGLPSLDIELEGRGSELDAIAGRRTSGLSRTVIQGAPGVGKTDLLKAYLKKNADVKFRLWFDASTEEGLFRQYQDIYNKELLSSFGECEGPVMRTRIIHLLENLIGPAIIVYDHAKTHNELGPFLPNIGHGLEILISSFQTLWLDSDRLPQLMALPGREPVISREEALRGLKPNECTVLIAAAVSRKMRSELRALFPAGGIATLDFNDIFAELKKRGMIETAADGIVTVHSPYREALAQSVAAEHSGGEPEPDTAPKPR